MFRLHPLRATSAANYSPPEQNSTPRVVKSQARPLTTLDQCARLAAEDLRNQPVVGNGLFRDRKPAEVGVGAQRAKLLRNQRGGPGQRLASLLVSSKLLLGQRANRQHQPRGNRNAGRIGELIGPLDGL